MEDIISIVSFAMMFLILIALGFLFFKLVKISVELNDLRYYIKRPLIPFEEKTNFPYLIETPSKSLL